jgi:hypothetical protein
MSSQIELLIQLKTQLVNFFDELIETLPDEPDFVIFRIFIKDQVPTADVMDYIITNLIPLQDLVKTKNEDFFLNNNILFEKYDNNRVNHFKRLWLSTKVDNEDRDVIWKWFASFLYLANKYREIS